MQINRHNYYSTTIIFHFDLNVTKTIWKSLSFKTYFYSTFSTKISGLNANSFIRSFLDYLLKTYF